jgi:chemotaxis protein methyltransferase CheR
MGDREFKRLSEFIVSELGIKMPPAKRTMLESRLQRRLRTLGMPSFGKYLDYVFSDKGLADELVQMIDLVTTNKTDFFREPAHFDYLVRHALPALDREFGAGHRRPLALWSAGCSTGEEPYTIAMTLSEYSERARGFRFAILATDVSTKVLDIAHAGIYDALKAEPIPPPLRRKYLLRSKDRKRDLVRIVPELRSLVKFRRLNFMESDFGLRERMDVIFCRNVIIYFDRPTQERLLRRLCGHLLPGGFVFMGHSETLSGLRVPLHQVAPTVYRLPH